ncbi:MAG: hypothetical protein KIT87_25620 [Anaerolineae bacterium]|nr:hypothetical protein [Anaerolineae bacterium]
MKVSVVVPTIRESSIQNFLAAWQVELAQTHIIVVEDNPEPTFGLAHSLAVTHYSWQDIERDLGQDSWIIPRRTDCIRSYGYYKAYLHQPDLIITLDDDCYPDSAHPDFVQRHWERIQAGGLSEAWCSTGEGTLPRGVPYFNRRRHWPCVLNHGLWTQIPDFDAPTQLLHSRHPTPYIPIDQTIPVGQYFPMCGMNVAFVPHIVPAFYFWLMGRDYEYDRFGDIWAGICLKKICDHLGYAINSGGPYIAHQRASNVWDNLRKEAAALRMNEELWAVVDRMTLHGATFQDCYREVAHQLTIPGDYWTRLKHAMLHWADLF